MRQSFLPLINVTTRKSWQLSCWKNLLNCYLSRNIGAELNFTSLLSLCSIWGALWRAHFHQATTKAFALSIFFKKGTRPKGRRKEQADVVSHVVSHLWKANPSQSKPSARQLAGGSSRLHDSDQAVSEVPRFIWVSCLRWDLHETYWTYHLYRSVTVKQLRQNRKLESGAAISAGLQTNHCNSPGVVANCQTCIAGGYLEASHISLRIHKANGTSELVTAREITASFCGTILPIVREVKENLQKCRICADLSIHRYTHSKRSRNPYSAMHMIRLSTLFVAAPGVQKQRAPPGIWAKDFRILESQGMERRQAIPANGIQRGSRHKIVPKSVFINL